jgi:glycosyltransferase involved in cell wall biosynthesis
MEYPHGLSGRGSADFQKSPVATESEGESQQGLCVTGAVSVCMATYNGDLFVGEQIRSILGELRPTDELIVVDDFSSDDTLQIVEAFHDARIRVFRNERNLGHVASFEKAIGLIRNPVILLADQDDRWLPGRVERLVWALEKSGAMVATSNSTYMDRRGVPTTGSTWRVSASRSRQHLRNILRIFAGRAAYFGCAMAFRRDLVALILPVPRFVESHDLWIALAANMARSNVHLDGNTLVRRIHGGNASLKRRTIVQKLRSRVIFACSLLVLASRYSGWRRLQTLAANQRG